jgi:hypothetical protein
VSVGLYIAQRAISRRAESSDTCGTECLSHSLIVPVLLHHTDESQKQVLAYALLDEQSDACFITDSALEKIGVKGESVRLKLAIPSLLRSYQSYPSSGTSFFSLNISSKYSVLLYRHSRPIRIRQVRDVNILCNSAQSVERTAKSIIIVLDQCRFKSHPLL